MLDPTLGDLPTHRRTFNEMSHDERLAFVKYVRERRLVIDQNLKSTRLILKARKVGSASVERLLGRIDALLSKALDCIDKAEGMYNEKFGE